MISITKSFKFEAAHKLPYYVGACHNLHGHSYQLDVTITGKPIFDESNSKCGMIMDFKDLKALVKKLVIDRYDHSYLNDFFKNPTAENMVVEIGEEILNALPRNVYLQSVKLWETATSYAEYKPAYYSSNYLKSAT